MDSVLERRVGRGQNLSLVGDSEPLLGRSWHIIDGCNTGRKGDGLSCEDFEARCRNLAPPPSIYTALPEQFLRSSK
jgi:hypothetical protein